MNFDKLKVLLVDDKNGVRASLKWILKGLGVQNFLEAENGLEALKILKEEKQDLIISDFMMDKMDGVEFLNELKKINDWKDIPFIFFVMFVDDVSSASGADSIIGKLTYSPEDFQARVRGVLEKRKGQKDKEFLQFLADRTLMAVYYLSLYKPLNQAVFVGRAEKWEKFSQPEFQAFMDDNKISPATEIIVWEKDGQKDAYVVTKK